MWCRSRLELPLPHRQRAGAGASPGRPAAGCRRPELGRRSTGSTRCSSGWRGAAPPFEPPASRAAGPHDRTRRRRARSEAAPPPAPLSAGCGRTMPPGWGTWCRSQAASIPSCRVEAGAVRQPVDFRRERGPVGGRGGGAPRQALPGTREAWPQRVGWLPCAKQTRPPTLGNLCRENPHTRTVRSLLHAVSTRGKHRMS